LYTFEEVLMRAVKLGSLVLGAAVVTACGGGGDDAGGSSTALTVASYASVTESVVDGVAAMSGSSLGTDLVTPASVPAADAGVVATLPVLSGAPVQMVRFALGQLGGGVAAGLKVQPQVEVTQDVPCISGSLRMVNNDADNNSRRSRGDSLTLVAYNCVAEAGTSPINGQMALVLGDVVLNSSGEVVSGSINLSFSNFNADGASMNGSTDVTLNTDGSVVTKFNRLTVSEGTRSTTVDYRLTVYANSTATVDGPVSFNNATYTLSTPTRMVLGATNPAAGLLRITDGQGNRVDVLLAPYGYTARLYLRGDEVLDSSTVLTW
jgi:hypothetical protein